MSYEEFEDIFAGGKMLPTHQTTKGFPVASETIPTLLQIATFWYYLLGKCTTTGTDTAITGRNVTYGGTGKIITIDGAALVASAWIGYVLVVTSGDQINHYWYITANSTTTITLEESDTNLPSNLNGDVVKIVGPPYTHAITMANQGDAVPSFTMHGEWADWSLYMDFLGCVVTEIDQKLKAEGQVEDAVTIDSPYHIAGANRSMPSPQFLALKNFAWTPHLNVFQVQYNGTNLDSVTDLRSWVDEITNNVTRKHIYHHKGGDSGKTAVTMQEFTWECKFNYRAQGLQIDTIRKLQVSSYAGAITWQMQLYRSATDYITYAVDKCKLELPENLKMPSKDDAELIVPVTLKLAPDATGAAFTITAVDAYSHKYYEDESE
jgi:hypothetical protein